MLFDIKSVQSEAEKELREERTKKAKEKIKAKLKQIQDAEAIVANLKREYDDLIAAIADDNG